MGGIWPRVDLRSGRDEIVQAVNAVSGALAGLVNDGKQWRNTQYDGKTPGVNGSVATTGNYALLLRSTIGKHLAVLFGGTADTAVPSPANAIVLIDDTGLLLASGKVFRLYGPGGTNYSEAKGDDNGLLTLGGLGALAGSAWLTGTRIFSNFSDATFANRLMFQSATANGITIVSALPNGSASVAGFGGFSNATPTSADVNIVIEALATEGAIVCASPTGAFKPMTFYTSGTKQVQIETTGVLTLTQGQIAFPATQVPSAGANVLDDYEEGTWTPSLGGSATYTTQSGDYVKVGRVVHAWCTLTVNAIGTGSTTAISGLPFAADRLASAAVSRVSSAATAAVAWTGYVNGSTISIDGHTTTNSTGSAGAIAVFGAGTSIEVMVTYRTAN